MRALELCTFKSYSDGKLYDVKRLDFAGQPLPALIFLNTANFFGKRQRWFFRNNQMFDNRRNYGWSYSSQPN